MITKFKKYNESIKSLLVGPTKEEVWNNLGYDRVFDSPEEFFIYLIDGMKVKEQTKYPKSVFWTKNNKLIFQQDFITDVLYVDIDIWEIFKRVFNFKFYTEVQSFIKTQIDKYLNWEKLTPEVHHFLGRI